MPQADKQITTPNDKLIRIQKKKSLESIVCLSATESEVLPLVSDIYTQWLAIGQNWFSLI